MTTLNTIIEEEKKEFDAKFCNERVCRGCLNKECDHSTTGCPWYQNDVFLGTDNATQVKNFLTTAMQRAYEAGRADGAQENIYDKLKKEALDLSELHEVELGTPDTDVESVEMMAQQLMDNPQFQSSDPITVLSLLVSALSSRDTYWKERVRKEVEGVKRKFANNYEAEIMRSAYLLAKKDILQALK